ncbi:hypothetical protein Pmani_033037 [Petrolisthes manimaculis]|uniref:Uncharacterized protein n=1 Tax=Petrolisthes manimaculis TaxID=1843537 RepID=A0AAE1NSB2_9EUCA|nr:hypothetical protein Pmani_033037 [Petrolisthes manimaculis]
MGSWSHLGWILWVFFSPVLAMGGPKDDNTYVYKVVDDSKFVVTPNDLRVSKLSECEDTRNLKFEASCWLCGKQEDLKLAWDRHFEMAFTTGKCNQASSKLDNIASGRFSCHVSALPFPRPKFPDASRTVCKFKTRLDKMGNTLVNLYRKVYLFVDECDQNGPGKSNSKMKRTDVENLLSEAKTLNDIEKDLEVLHEKLVKKLNLQGETSNVESIAEDILNSDLLKYDFFTFEDPFITNTASSASTSKLSSTASSSDSTYKFNLPSIDSITFKDLLTSSDLLYTLYNLYVLNFTPSEDLFTSILNYHSSDSSNFNDLFPQTSEHFISKLTQNKKNRSDTLEDLFPQTFGHLISKLTQNKKNRSDTLEDLFPQTFGHLISKLTQNKKNRSDTLEDLFPQTFGHLISKLTQNKKNRSDTLEDLFPQTFGHLISKLTQNKKNRSDTLEDLFPQTFGHLISKLTQNKKNRSDTLEDLFPQTFGHLISKLTQNKKNRSDTLEDLFPQTFGHLISKLTQNKKNRSDTLEDLFPQTFGHLISKLTQNKKNGSDTLEDLFPQTKYKDKSVTVENWFNKITNKSSKHKPSSKDFITFQVFQDLFTTSDFLYNLYNFYKINSPSEDSFTFEDLFISNALLCNSLSNEDLFTKLSHDNHLPSSEDFMTFQDLFTTSDFLYNLYNFYKLDSPSEDSFTFEDLFTSNALLYNSLSNDPVTFEDLLTFEKWFPLTNGKKNNSVTFEDLFPLIKLSDDSHLPWTWPLSWTGIRPPIKHRPLRPKPGPPVKPKFPVKITAKPLVISISKPPVKHKPLVISISKPPVKHKPTVISISKPLIISKPINNNSSFIATKTDHSISN